MPHCLVDNCGNYYGKTRGSKVKYHMLPNNQTLATKWVRTCGKKELHEVPIHARVCSDHFSAKCYQRDLQHELLGLPLRKRLRHDAVPDRNLPHAHGAKPNNHGENIITNVMEKWINKPSVIKVVPKVEAKKRTRSEKTKTSVVPKFRMKDLPDIVQHRLSNDEERSKEQSKKVLNPLAIENCKITNGKKDFSDVRNIQFALSRKTKYQNVPARGPKGQVSTKGAEPKNFFTKHETKTHIHNIQNGSKHNNLTSTPNKRTLLKNAHIVLLTPISNRMPSPIKQYSNKIYEKFKIKTRLRKEYNFESNIEHELQTIREKPKKLPMRSSIRIAKKKSIESLSDSFTEKVNNKDRRHSKRENFSDKLKFMAKLQLRFQKNMHYMTLPKYNMELSLQKVVAKEVVDCGYVVLNYMVLDIT